MTITYITDNSLVNSAPPQDVIDVAVIDRSGVESTLLDNPIVEPIIEDKKDNEPKAMIGEENNGLVDGKLTKGLRSICKPNAQCPCGSGKKFKKCCGKFA